MAKFLGNIHNKIFDCNELLAEIKESGGAFEEDYMTDEHGNIRDDMPDIMKDYCSKWLKAGYPDPICKGTIYLPHYHFNEKFVYELDKFFGTVCNKCFISEVPPGKIVPPHQDIDLREERLLELGEIIAFHVHLGEPEAGHVFMIEDHAHYMEANGNAYQWDYFDSWHSGSNTGFTNKYFLTYRGTRFKQPTEYTYRWHDDDETVGIVVNGEEY